MTLIGKKPEAKTRRSLVNDAHVPVPQWGTDACGENGRTRVGNRE
jgi:hypothetical protein